VVILESAISRMTMSSTIPLTVILIFFASYVKAGPPESQLDKFIRNGFPQHLRISAETEEPLAWGGPLLGDYILEPDIRSLKGTLPLGVVYKHKYLSYYLYAIQNDYLALGQDYSKVAYYAALKLIHHPSLIVGDGSFANEDTNALEKYPFNFMLEFSSSPLPLPPFVGPCKYEVSSTGPFAQKYADLMGVYDRVEFDECFGRQVWRKQNYYLMMQSGGSWVFSSAHQCNEKNAEKSIFFGAFDDYYLYTKLPSIGSIRWAHAGSDSNDNVYDEFLKIKDVCGAEDTNSIELTLDDLIETGFPEASGNTGNTGNTETSKIIASLSSAEFGGKIFIETSELFSSLPYEDQEFVIQNIDVDVAEELLSISTLNEQALTPQVIEKLSADCDQNCIEEKQKTLVKIAQIEDTVNEQEESWNKVTADLEKAEKVLEEISKFAFNYDLATFNSDIHKKRLVEKIDNAHKQGYLNDNQYKLMKEQVENAADFDPTVVPSIHAIKASTVQELNTRRRQSLEKEGTWKKIKSEMTAWKTGVKSMSKTETVGKSGAVAGHIFSGVQKFGAKNSDGSPDSLQILSGVSDIATGLAEFLPPPASVVTGTVSNLLSMFGLGGPSTEEVVKEEFQKMKKFTADLIDKQNKYIEDKFGEQSILIREQTREIIYELSNKLDQKAELILKEIQQTTKKQTDDFIKFLKTNEFENLLTEADALNGLADVHLSFISAYKPDKTISDLTAEVIISYLPLYVASELDIGRFQNNFEKTCLDARKQYMQLPFYTVNQNRLCSELLYMFLANNMKRESVLSEILALLQLHPSYERRDSVKGYWSIARNSKKQIKAWVQSKITNNLNLFCPLFIIDVGNWKSPIYKQYTLNFIKNIDPDFVYNKQAWETCQNVVENNVKKHCQCNEKGSSSIYCYDREDRKCICKEHFKGDECEVEEAILITGGDGAKQSAEIFNPWLNSMCELPPLPDERVGHVQSGNTLCGGGYTLRSCIQWSVQEGGWVTLPLTLTEKRDGSSVWKLSQDNSFVIMGGLASDADETSETVSSDGVSTRRSLNMEYPIWLACSISLGDKVVLTGGWADLARRVSLYSTDRFVKYMPNLNKGRYNHGCTSYTTGGEQVLLVTGGFDVGGGYKRLDSTEVLYLSWSRWAEISAKLPRRLSGVRLITVNNRVLLFGGMDDGDEHNDDILHVEGNSWSNLGTMTKGRSGHSLSVVNLADFPNCN